MLKHSRQVQRLMFLFAIAGLFAVTADFACLEDVCADSQTGAYRTMGDIAKERIRTLDEALAESGVTLTPDQRLVARPGWPAARRGQARPAGEAPQRQGRDGGRTGCRRSPRGIPGARPSPRPTTPSTRSSRSGSSGPSSTTRRTRSTRRRPQAYLAKVESEQPGVHRLDGRVAHRVREDQGRRRRLRPRRRACSAGAPPTRGPSDRRRSSAWAASAIVWRQGTRALVGGARAVPSLPPVRAERPAASSRRSTRGPAPSSVSQQLAAPVGSPRVGKGPGGVEPGPVEAGVELPRQGEARPAPRRSGRARARRSRGC